MTACSSINYNAIEKRARKLADNAKDGTLKIGEDSYHLTFDRNENNYKVTLNGESVVNFNTRSIKQAKQWLDEWLNN